MERIVPANQFAIDAPTQLVESRGRTLAYRSLGDGPPIVLCLRLRGVMDSWDPAFLDALAAEHRVVVFDYTGLGRSTGTPSYRREAMAADAIDLVDALGLERVVIAGWSLGSIAAQIFAARHPERTSHAVLIGSLPPGPPAHRPDPRISDVVAKPELTLDDERFLFFEPRSPRSAAAAEASHARIARRIEGDRSPQIPESTYLPLFRESADPSGPFPDPEGRYAAFLETTDIPILAICGDHDIVYPVENWHELRRKWSSLHVLVIPEAGHGPHHQEPWMCAETIAAFVRTVKRGA